MPRKRNKYHFLNSSERIVYWVLKRYQFLQPKIVLKSWRKLAINDSKLIIIILIFFFNKQTKYY